MKKMSVIITAMVMAALLFSTLPAQEKQNRDLWPMGAYIQSAKIHYQQVYRPTKDRKELYHCIDLLKEAAARFGRVPELNFMLGTFYAEINSIDTMVMYFDSVVAMCADESIDEKYRKSCNKKDNYIEKMDKLREDKFEKSYNDAIGYIEQLDMALKFRKECSEDSAAYYDGKIEETFDRASTSFNNAMLSKPDRPGAPDGYGVLLQRVNRHQEAITYYKKAMDLLGREDSALVSKIAYAYIYDSDWLNAAEWFQKALTHAPSDLNALINISVAYNNLDSLDRWYEYTERIIQIDPGNTQSLFNAGQYWFVKMQEAATQISELNDSIPEQKARREKLDTQAKEYMEKAAGYFERILAIDVNDSFAARQLGILYLLSGQPNRAIETLEKFVAVRTDDNDVLDFLGRAYIMSGDTKAAIRPYEILVQNDPGNIKAWENLAELYQYNGMPEKAAEAQKKVEELKKQ